MLRWIERLRDKANMECQHLLEMLVKWIFIVLPLIFIQLFYILEIFKFKSQYRRQNLSVIGIVRWGSWFLFKLHVVSLSTRLIRSLGRRGHCRTSWFLETQEPSFSRSGCPTSHSYGSWFSGTGREGGSTCIMQVDNFSICNSFCLAGKIDSTMDLIHAWCNYNMIYSWKLLTLCIYNMINAVLIV